MIGLVPTSIQPIIRDKGIPNNELRPTLLLTSDLKANIF